MSRFDQITKYIIPLNMKGCIWQIHPFISEGTILNSMKIQYLLRLMDYTMRCINVTRVLKGFRTIMAVPGAQKVSVDVNGASHRNPDPGVDNEGKRITTTHDQLS